MSTEMLIAIVAGVFTVGGAAIAAGSAILGSYLDHRRKEKSEREAAEERERAILHGAFALTNFINGKLNDWDETRNVYGLARLSVAQPYLAKLIDRSPPESDRLMVSLVDLGLRLEALMFTCGFVVGSNHEPDPDDLPGIERSIGELSRAVDLVEVIVTGELPFMDEDELAQFQKLGPNEDGQRSE